MRVTRVVSEKLLSSIGTLVRQAQASKPQAQQFTDRLAVLFVPFILALSTVVFTVWLGLGLTGAVDSALRHVRRDFCLAVRSVHVGGVVPLRHRIGRADCSDGGHGSGGQARDSVQRGR